RSKTSSIRGSGRCRDMARDARNRDTQMDNATARADQPAGNDKASTRGTAASTAPVVLSVEDVWIEYKTPFGWIQAVRGATMEIRQGEAVALIGESGSGKSTLGFGILRMLPRNARITQGRIMYTYA